MIIIFKTYWITFKDLSNMELVINGFKFKKARRIYGPLWKVCT